MSIIITVLDLKGMQLNSFAKPNRRQEDQQQAQAVDQCLSMDQCQPMNQLQQIVTVPKGQLQQFSKRTPTLPAQLCRGSRFINSSKLSNMFAQWNKAASNSLTRCKASLDRQIHQIQKIKNCATKLNHQNVQIKNNPKNQVKCVKALHKRMNRLPGWTTIIIK